jgi:hypothetical protein
MGDEDVTEGLYSLMMRPLLLCCLATVSTGADTTPPTVTSFTISPVNASTVASATAITIGFSEAIDATAISSATVQLIASGGDGTFGDGNETAIAVPASLIAPDHLRIDLSGLTLANDTYRVRLAATPGGAALHFDGSGQVATMLNTAVLNPTAALTLECWFNYEPGGNWNPRMIERDYYNIGTTGLGSPRVIGVGYGLDGTTLVPAGTWHHAAMTAVNGGTWNLYLDGQLDKTISGVTFPASSIPLRLGRSRNVGYDQYQGTIDEVRVWNVARTQAEIQATMSVALRGDEPGLIGYWRLDEGSGQSAADATGNGTTSYLGDSAVVESNDATWTTSGAPLTGIRDLAGNLLDGEVAGADPAALPSGDGIAGGDAWLTFTINPSVGATGSGSGSGGSGSGGSTTSGVSTSSGGGTKNFFCGLGGGGTAAVILALALMRRRGLGG